MFIDFREHKENTTLPESMFVHKYCKEWKMAWIAEFLALNAY